MSICGKRRRSRLVEFLQTPRPMRIVCIGGGTGLPVVLSGLRELGDIVTDLEITAVVCVSDNGGSSGVLRQAFNTPAMGDLRNCLVALSTDRSALVDLFQYRLPHGEGLRGHPLGNLIVSGLASRSSSFCEAIREAAKLLHCRGEVLPATESPTTLCAEFADGSVVRGEVEITSHGGSIQRVWIEPGPVPPAQGLLPKLRAADVIVLGPGSLYTSVIPNLLVPGVAEAIRRSSAVKVLISNLVTQPGETGGYSASAHLSAVQEYLGGGAIHFCGVNAGLINDRLLARYRSIGSVQVECDLDAITRRGVTPILADLVDENSTEIRHDPLKLARLITSLRGQQRSSKTVVLRSRRRQTQALPMAASGD
jgi:uncharacterized cofD-like protein